MPKAKRMPNAVRRALDGTGVKIPQIGELVGHFMELAGGTKQMAKMLMDEYLRAKEGSIIRQRILDSILRMLMLANQQYGAIEETDLIDLPDLEAEAMKLLGEFPGGEEEVDPEGSDEEGGGSGEPDSKAGV